MWTPHSGIVFVWSQYDGGNIEQRTIGYGCRQNQEAKLKIVGGVLFMFPFTESHSCRTR